VYPAWANVLGWIIAGSSVAMIPAVALYQYLNTSGTHLQVISSNDISVTVARALLPIMCKLNTDVGIKIVCAEIKNSHHTLAGRTRRRSDFYKRTAYTL